MQKGAPTTRKLPHKSKKASAGTGLSSVDPSPNPSRDPSPARDPPAFTFPAAWAGRRPGRFSAAAAAAADGGIRVQTRQLLETVEDFLGGLPWDLQLGKLSGYLVSGAVAEVVLMWTTYSSVPWGG